MLQRQCPECLVPHKLLRLQVCNVMADPVQDRPPKLIFQLGAAGVLAPILLLLFLLGYFLHNLGSAAGTGKSTRMKDCYATMGIETETSLVVADGDSIRESHKVNPSNLSNLLVKACIGRRGCVCTH